MNSGPSNPSLVKRARQSVVLPVDAAPMTYISAVEDEWAEEGFWETLIWCGKTMVSVLSAVIRSFKYTSNAFPISVISVRRSNQTAEY